MQKLYRHKKRGSTYRILHEAVLQLEGLYDMAPVVVYQDIANGSVWVRLRKEFFDGRFEEIDQPVTPAPAV